MSAASVDVVVTSGERHEGKVGMVLFAGKLCDPCLSALDVPWCEKALYRPKYSSFLSFPLSWRLTDDGVGSQCWLVCIGSAALSIELNDSGLPRFSQSGPKRSTAEIRAFR